MWRHVTAAAVLLAISLACAQPQPQPATTTTTNGVTVTTAPGAAPVVSAPRPATPPAAPMAVHREPLAAEVGGFRFGAPIAEVQAACIAAGHAWDVSGWAPVCEGTLAEIGYDAHTRIRVCDGAVCGVTFLIISSSNVDADWTTLMGRLARTLRDRYGPASDGGIRGDDYCRERINEDDLMCVRYGRASIVFRWVMAGGVAVLSMNRLGDSGSDLLIDLAYGNTALLEQIEREEAEQRQRL